MKATTFAIALAALLIGCASGAQNPLGARLHEMDDAEYEAAATRHGVDAKQYEAFAVHRDGRCADVYLRGYAFRTTYQQHKMVRIAACNGERIARE